MSLYAKAYLEASKVSNLICLALSHSLHLHIFSNHFLSVGNFKPKQLFNLADQVLQLAVSNLPTGEQCRPNPRFAICTLRKEQRKRPSKHNWHGSYKWMWYYILPVLPPPPRVSDDDDSDDEAVFKIGIQRNSTPLSGLLRSHIPLSCFDGGCGCVNLTSQVSTSTSPKREAVLWHHSKWRDTFIFDPIWFYLPGLPRSLQKKRPSPIPCRHREFAVS